MATAKRYGPYKGSKQNDGRPIYVYKKSGGGTTSSNAARVKKEESVGKKLPKSSHVAHRSGTNKGGNHSISSGSTRVESSAKNIGDGNKTRVGKPASNPKIPRKTKKAGMNPPIRPAKKVGK